MGKRQPLEEPNASLPTQESVLTTVSSKMELQNTRKVHPFSHFLEVFDAYVNEMERIQIICYGSTLGRVCIMSRLITQYNIVMNFKLGK